MKTNNYLKAELKGGRLEADLRENGYCYLPNFLSKETLHSLQSLFENVHLNNENSKGMWNSLFDLKENESEEVSQKILELLKPKLDALFESYSAPVASFMSKNAGEKGVCELHRDFSILDEEKFEYRNVWIPLVDIQKENGALYALKGSHNVFNYPLPMFQKWPYTDLQEELFDKVDVFEVKAGDLVIYADRTLHGSFLNLSQKPRPVVHLGALHPQFETAYYHLNEETVEVYKVPFSFFFENNYSNLKERFSLIKSFKYNPPEVKL